MPLPPGRARSALGGQLAHVAVVVVRPDQRDVVGHLHARVVEVQHLLVRDEDLRLGAPAPTSSARIRRWSAMMSFITATFSGIVVAFFVSSALSCRPRMPSVQLLS